MEIIQFRECRSIFREVFRLGFRSVSVSVSPSNAFDWFGLNVLGIFSSIMVYHGSITILFQSFSAGVLFPRMIDQRGDILYDGVRRKWMAEKRSVNRRYEI